MDVYNFLRALSGSLLKLLVFIFGDVISQMTMAMLESARTPPRRYQRACPNPIAVLTAASPLNQIVVTQAPTGFG